MAKSESPHSVNASSNLDLYTQICISGSRQLNESLGRKIADNETPVIRSFVVGDEFSMRNQKEVVFEPGEEEDEIKFSGIRAGESLVIVQNHSYIEIEKGTANGSGWGKYSLSDGTVIEAAANVGAFEKFDVPLAISPEVVNIIRDVCTKLRNNGSTPSPLLFDALYTNTAKVIQTSTPTHDYQPELISA